MKIKKEIIAGLSGDGRVEHRFQWYPELQGLRRIEQRMYASESDFFNVICQRESSDNGTNWGEWRDVTCDFNRMDGNNEIVIQDPRPPICNPIHKHILKLDNEELYLDGHVEAYRRFWHNGENQCKLHVFMETLDAKGNKLLDRQLIKYEEGADHNPQDPAYYNNNQAYHVGASIAANGDVLIPLGAYMPSCCKLLGIDTLDVFPSCPYVTSGFILARAKWDRGKSKYDLSYSKPVVISDLQSCRGLDEPAVAELKSGRILAVMRGANGVIENWNTRIIPSAPGFKWFAFSDDGGRTFSPAMPWHFDTHEIVYSSATLSDLVRSEKNGNLYWIGNITDPTATEGGYPRWPLYICQVDEHYGVLLKDTLTMIDTKGEDESDKVQLSNFYLLQDRVTGNLEIRLLKLGQYSEKLGTMWQAETMLYTVVF